MAPATDVPSRTAHDWYRALTLAERLALLRRCGERASRGEGRCADRARPRLERWRVQKPFDQERLFSQRLAADDLAEEELVGLLALTSEELATLEAEPPRWVERLEAAYSRPSGSRVTAPQQGTERAVAALFGPLLGPAFEALEAELRRMGSRACSPAGARELFLPQLMRRLSLMAGRTLALELHAARLQGRLAGDSPEERFESFVERLGSSGEAGALLREYPVLARQALLAIDLWAASSLELLRHLRDDRQILGETFSEGADPGPLVALSGGLGDAHRGGRRVLILRFLSGLELVYKPRSLAADQAFGSLVEWVSRAGFEPALRRLRLVDGGDHGWVERVEVRPCRSTAEVRRFYLRQGGYLALFHLLQATDLHRENLIAVGEHPVPVDLEALFQPRIDTLDARSEGPRPGGALQRSLLRLGLLPQWIGGRDGARGVDLSGLHSPGGQVSPEAVLQAEGEGTDQVRFLRRPTILPPSENRPSLEGTEVEVAGHAEEIEEGFSRMYRLIAAHRDELLSPGGPLAAFASVEVRVLVRPTRGYASLLAESFHPDLLRDALERDRHFDRLWVGVDRRPYLAALIPAERSALERIDIPLLTARAGTTDLWAGEESRLPGFFSSSGLERVRQGIASWGEEDCERQRWLVRGSLATLVLGSEAPRGAPYEVRALPGPPPTDSLLAVAREVGDRLAVLAFGDDEEAGWFDFRLVAQDRWSLEPADLSLYSGLPGIVLFLAYLAAVTEEERFQKLLRRSWCGLRSQLDRVRGVDLPIGAFNGWGGVVFTLLHLAALWGDPAILAWAEEGLGDLAEHITRDETFDVVGGAAGCLLALLRLHEERPGTAALDLAVRCGERLLAGSRPMETGCGWQITAVGPWPLAGLAHGSAGIAWALLELAAATGDERYRDRAREAIAYERYLFCTERRNWPDLRKRDAAEAGSASRSDRFLVAWCHGAPGVGLARSLCRRHLEAGEVDQEIATAVGTTLDEGLGDCHCLCHGDLGSLDALLTIGHELGETDLRERVGWLARGVLASMETRGWRSGLPAGVESTGLLLGLAGIGYGLLRLAAPERVPSVLALEPPRRLPGGAI